LATRSTRKSAYCPDTGDIVWIDFQPQAGREIDKRRPALVLSPRNYNRKAELCVVCALTASRKGYPFEVDLADGGVVLADQIKNLSWKARAAAFKNKAPATVVADVRIKLKALLGIG
jgi:mRNA interferase MazF